MFLDRQSAILVVMGELIQLKAVIVPEGADQSVVWSSSDDTVATVDRDGTVTAVSAGEAKITASAGGESAECAVTVTSALLFKSSDAFSIALPLHGIWEGEFEWSVNGRQWSEVQRWEEKEAESALGPDGTDHIILLRGYDNKAIDDRIVIRPTKADGEVSCFWKHNDAS